MTGQAKIHDDSILSKQAIINRLRKDMLALQGIRTEPGEKAGTFGLGPVELAFPNATCPSASIHEFLISAPEHAASCAGFLSGLLQTLMQNDRACLWISTSRTLFPPALQAFGISPDKIIFVDLQGEKDILWVMEEALKCEGLTAVVAEVREISFAQSRRLQLVVEKSKVTGFILRSDPFRITATAAVARWRISPLPSQLEEGMPGVGFPRWKVELLKVRNGNPGTWKMEWVSGHFKPIEEFPAAASSQQLDRKAG